MYDQSKFQYFPEPAWIYWMIEFTSDTVLSRYWVIQCNIKLFSKRLKWDNIKWITSDLLINTKDDKMFT